MTTTIIVNNDTCTGEYDMFDVRSMDEEGAVLCGPLFLEIGETLQLRVSQGEETIEILAKVLSVASHDEAMTVLFVDLKESDKALIRDATTESAGADSDVATPALEGSPADTDISPAPVKAVGKASGKHSS